MASPLEHARVRAWLRQAEADFRAARIDTEGISECHQRYWLQQSYEKAIKAYAWMIWSWEDVARDDAERAQDQQQPGQREKNTRSIFFREHSPIHAMRANNHNSKSLRVLARQIENFVQNLGHPHADNILKIDATCPSIDPQYISYRYPFEDHGNYIAPADYPNQDWSNYQGDNVPNLLQSVECLYRKVHQVFQRYR